MKKALRNTIKFPTIFLAILPIFLGLPSHTHAADFEAEIQYTYEVSSDKEYVHIVEERTVRNYNRSYYIPAGSDEQFIIPGLKETPPEGELQFKRDSIEITNGYGSPLNYETETTGNDIYVTTQYPSSVTYGQTQVFRLEYNTRELIENVGQVTNVFVPGFEELLEESVTDTQTGTTTQNTVTVQLKVPESLGEASFINPEPSSTDSQNSTKTMTYTQEDLLGQGVWYQIGTEQTYHFKITQPTVRSDDLTPEQLDFFSKNKYKIIIPRNYDETNQEVFFSKISPEPAEISRDDDGNIYAIFYAEATKESEIIIEGYLDVSIEAASNNTLPNPDLSGIDADEMSAYLQSAEYWEVDAPEIQAKAEELAGDETSILEILKADYRFIVDSIDYDELKYGDRNTRQGALATLNGGDSVCMEYSDLLITIARAQGIPARAAYGYGYDPAQGVDSQEEHQWVQVWIPDYGWLSIDPTWGENGRDFIGQDLDHALWYVASEHPDEPAPLEVISANLNGVDIESSTVEFEAITEIPSEINLMTLDELEEEVGTEDSKFYQLSRTVQTTIIGRILVIVTPLCGAGVIILFLLLGINKTIKAIKKK